MKVAIILALVAVVSLEAGATKVYQIYPVTRTDDMNLDQLIDAINFVIQGTQKRFNPRTGTQSETQEAPEVARLLAKTKPKNVIHPMLKFSINDLLKLNEWTVDDCSDAEFGKRRAMCTQYFEEGRFENGPRDMIHLERKDYVHYNLGKYCWNVVHELKSKCLVERRQQAVDEFMSTFGVRGGSVLSSFESQLINHIFNNEVPAKQWEHYKKAVMQVFAKSSKKAELKQICKALVPKLLEFYNAQSLTENWTKKFEMCSIINGIQVDN